MASFFGQVTAQTLEHNADKYRAAAAADKNAPLALTQGRLTDPMRKKMGPRTAPPAILEPAVPFAGLGGTGTHHR
ncbi:MAG: hypothetical protein ABR964_00195 [Tepidisphaeraceae bacterium]